MRPRALLIVAATRSALALAAVSVVLLAAGQASAAVGAAGRAGSQGWVSRIASPTAGQVVLGRSVKVVVKVGKGVRSFKASLAGKDVTRFFRPAANGTERLAVLRSGTATGLRFGRDSLVVSTGDGRGHWWYSTRSFLLARSQGGLLSGSAVEPGCGTGSRLSVDLSRAGLSVSVSVNGGQRFSVGGGRQRSRTLTADDGLKPGRNTISVRVLDATRGAYQLKQLSVLMPAETPVAGAGSARRSKTGRVVTFNAGASVGAAGATGLRYRWTILTRPARSRARLRDATAVRPSLRPDRPGRYVLRVTVTQAASGHVAVALLCSSRAASATTTLTAAVNAPATGLALRTLASQGGSSGVQVGVSFYASTNPQLAIQLVVLDRSTLALDENKSFGDDPAGAANLLSEIKSLSSRDLVIISKANLDNGGNANSAATINQALQAIGGDSVPATVATTGASCTPSAKQCSAFSAVGVPGIPVGQGTVNPGFGGLSGSTQGGLQGYLQENLTATGYTFVNTERVPLDTGSPTANPAVVTLGSNEAGSELSVKTYTSTKLSGPGFFVVVLDAGTLALHQQATFPTTATGLREMATLFSTLQSSDPSALVIVRTIGAVSRPAAGGGAQFNWDLIAGGLQTDFGGSAFYLQALDGVNSSQYAQVGPAGAGYPSQWTQVASKEASGSGELSGLLARNGENEFTLEDPYPSGLNDASRPLAGSLSGLLSLPQVAWPDRNTQGDQNVLDCIAAHIDPLGALQTPIESNYGNENLAGSWLGWVASIGAGDPSFTKFTGYTQTSSCQNFTRTDFDAVTGQLAQEWTAVGQVWTMIENMRSPLVDSQGNATEIGSIVSEINSAVSPGGSSPPSHFNYQKFALKLVNLAGEVPEIGDFIKYPEVVLATGFKLVSKKAQNPDGSSAAADISAPAAGLAAAVSESYTSQINGFEQIGAELVSNWAYLPIAAQNATDTKNAAADWSWTAAQGTAAANLLLAGVRQQTYETLFPIRYQLFRLDQGQGDFPASASAWTCDSIKQTQGLQIGYKVVTATPFSSLATPFGSLKAVVSGGGTAEYWVYATNNSWASQSLDATTKATVPTSDVLNQMFSTQASTGFSRPLFNPLQFDLEAYGSTGAPGQEVAHTKQHATPPSTVSTTNICAPQ